jgi:hypothetical protein
MWWSGASSEILLTMSSQATYLHAIFPLLCALLPASPLVLGPPGIWPRHVGAGCRILKVALVS